MQVTGVRIMDNSRRVAVSTVQQMDVVKTILHSLIPASTYQVIDNQHQVYTTTAYQNKGTI